MSSQHTRNETVIKSSKERGVTLVEVMMVLGIATAFIAGGLALYTNAQDGLTARDAVAAVMGAVAEVRGTYAAADDFANMPDDAVSVDNPFIANTAIITVEVNNNGGTAAGDDFAALIMNGIEEDICQRVVGALNSAEDITAWAAQHTAALTTAATAVPAGVLASGIQGTAGSADCGATAANNHLVVTVAHAG